MLSFQTLGTHILNNMNQSFAIPLAPVITSITSTSLNEITFSFTQTANDANITNYKYSIDNGSTYTAFSPVNTTSPLTITGLSPGTSYTISIKAVNVNVDSEPSNQINGTTYTQVHYARFTTVGEHLWLAPEGVTEVEYLVVGGGGGGGSTYSKINVLGNVLVTDIPQTDAYWINSANTTNDRYSGGLYYGNNLTASTFTDPVQLTASQNFTPVLQNGGVVNSNQKWYDFEMVYILNSALPVCTNTSYINPQGTPTPLYSNNISAGSGGGEGGSIVIGKVAITPEGAYTVIIGEGGTGGIAGPNFEYGSDTQSGRSSIIRFDDWVIARGGGPGYPSRWSFNQDGGGGFSNSTIIGGKGNIGGYLQQNGVDVGYSYPEEYELNTSVLRGTYGGSGFYTNFDGSGTYYGAGGDGGDPNIPSTEVSTNGKGGNGTGATLNSYCSGRDGSPGIAIIKYYT